MPKKAITKRNVRRRRRPVYRIRRAQRRLNRLFNNYWIAHHQRRSTEQLVNAINRKGKQVEALIRQHFPGQDLATILPLIIGGKIRRT